MWLRNVFLLQNQTKETTLINRYEMFKIRKKVNNINYHLRNRKTLIVSTNTTLILS